MKGTEKLWDEFKLTLSSSLAYEANLDDMFNSDLSELIKKESNKNEEKQDNIDHRE